MNTRSITNDIVRKKKDEINDLWYCILYLLYVPLFEKLYTPNICIATELYAWSHNLFVKYEFCRNNERVDPIICEWEIMEEMVLGHP